MGHSEISSVAEPHFLLPFVYANKSKGVLTEYSQFATKEAFDDVIMNLPGKETEYLRYLEEFALNIYSGLSQSDSIYFLDKTPRYFWIIPEIKKIFSEAKFIFLFRDPVQIYASLLETFGNGRFSKMYRFNHFIHEGISEMAKAYDLLKSESISIQYRDLISDSEAVNEKMSSYLGLQTESLIEGFSDQNPKGRFVDPTGIDLYDTIDKGPMNKWKKVFNTRFRKRELRRYIQSFPAHVLAAHGVDKNKSLQSIDAIDHRGKYSMLRDVIDLFKVKMIEKFHLNLYFDPKVDWVRNYYLN
jgi:hypothetical protein